MAPELVLLSNAKVYVRFRLAVKINSVKISPLMSSYFTVGLLRDVGAVVHVAAGRAAAGRTGVRTHEHQIRRRPGRVERPSQRGYFGQCVPPGQPSRG
jgi:hypothetical protein